LLSTALAALLEVARDLPVVFPVHPRTRARIESERLPTAGLRLLDPLGYVEFMSLVCGAAALLTDSGGVQEETSYLGIPCFTLRDNTERPITLSAGTNTLLGLEPERIRQVPELLSRCARRPCRIPGWDGQAARRLVDVLALPELPSRVELTAKMRPFPGEPLAPQPA
jgi:UDP-N-acetylglucosamine 2-epimerase (non-hydrolysing)